MVRARLTVLLFVAGLGCGMFAVSSPRTDSTRPHVLLISVDTLRADRLSSYGYRRNTSPNIDLLANEGVRFENARTVEPLTAPALASMITSLEPHNTGLTRNGLRVREGLVGMPKILRRRGYRTGAFVGNWTVKDKLSGLAEHFEEYREVLNRKRWLFFAGEATAEDLNSEALRWTAQARQDDASRPIFLWMHYVEPHAPYRLHQEFIEALGIKRGKTEIAAADRYDTEIAYVDRAIGAFLKAFFEVLPREHTLVVFVADHGESLGEHGYWGHGRHLYEVNLHIPMVFSWRGKLTTRVIAAPALITDIAPTILGLVGLPVPEFFQGFDWSDVLLGNRQPPTGRVTTHQAHKGAVKIAEAGNRPRQNGLLEVARIEGATKEILRVGSGRRWLFDLIDDPLEKKSQVPLNSRVSADLEVWREVVGSGLRVADDLPPPLLSAADVEALRSLGYLD